MSELPVLPFATPASSWSLQFQTRSCLKALYWLFSYQQGAYTTASMLVHLLKCHRLATSVTSPYKSTLLTFSASLPCFILLCSTSDLLHVYLCVGLLSVSPCLLQNLSSMGQGFFFFFFFATPRGMQSLSSLPEIKPVPRAVEARSPNH